MRSNSRAVVAARLAAVTVTQIAFFGAVAVRRSIDADEGWYAVAAVRVVDGDLPYVDFFYPQMPLLPYVYGLWTMLVGESWEAVRLLSVLLAALVGLLIFRHVERRFRSAWLALTALLLYTASTLVFAWFSVAKTYALTAALLVGAFVLLDGREGLRPSRLLLVGALLGLAIDVRLLAVAALPAFVLAAAAGRHPRRAAWLLTGVFVGTGPSWFFLAREPRRFLFDNLGFHLIRDAGDASGLSEKAKLVANLVGIGGVEGAVGVQFALLSLLALSLLGVRLRERRVPLSVAVALLLGLVSLAPSPAYPQYFALVVPFLVFAAAEFLHELRAPLAAGPVRAVRGPVAILGALTAGLYLGGGMLDYATYAARGGVQDPKARIAAVEEVTALIDVHTSRGDPVLSSWPGYLFGSDATPVDGVGLGTFVLGEVGKLSPSEAARYRLARREDVERLIRGQHVRLIVLRPWASSPPGPDWRRFIAMSGYLRLATRGTAEIYGLSASQRG